MKRKKYNLFHTDPVFKGQRFSCGGCCGTVFTREGSDFSCPSCAQLWDGKQVEALPVVEAKDLN